MTMNGKSLYQVSSCSTLAVLICTIGFLANNKVCAQSGQTPYNIDPNGVTVSGISSGADLAHQLHIAHSSLIHGVGLLAASPWYCAKGNSNTAMEYCSRFAKDAMGGNYTGPPDENYINGLVTATGTAFTNNQIDDPINVRDDKIYLFTGTNDNKVPQQIVATVKLYYTKLGVNPENIKYIDTVPAGHAMVTDDFGNQCDTSSSPYINKCANGDAAGQLLNHLYGGQLAPPTTAADSKIVKFCQRTFFVAGDSASMDNFGYAYIPKACANGASCKLHAAIHGCEQNDDQVQAQFYTRAGYNEWAEANNIIILYPQVQKTGGTNPYACWDWWGYSGPNYHTRAGKQVTAVKGMIDRVIAGGPLPAATAAECSDPCAACQGYFSRFFCRYLGVSCS